MAFVSGAPEQPVLVESPHRLGDEASVPSFLLHALAEGLVRWYGSLCMECGATASGSTNCVFCASNKNTVPLYVVSAPAGFGL